MHTACRHWLKIFMSFILEPPSLRGAREALAQASFASIPKWSLMTALAGDRTDDTSGQVINLNMNTAFKLVPHILGNLQFGRQ